MLQSAPPSSNMSDIHQIIANKVSQTISQEDASKQFQTSLLALRTALGKLSLTNIDISNLNIALSPLLIVLDNPNSSTVKEIAFAVALAKKLMPHLDNDDLLNKYQTAQEQPKPEKKNITSCLKGEDNRATKGTVIIDDYEFYKCMICEGGRGCLIGGGRGCRCKDYEIAAQHAQEQPKPKPKTKSKKSMAQEWRDATRDA